MIRPARHTILKLDVDPPNPFLAFGFRLNVFPPALALAGAVIHDSFPRVPVNGTPEPSSDGLSPIQKKDDIAFLQVSPRMYHSDRDGVHNHLARQPLYVFHF